MSKPLAPLPIKLEDGEEHQFTIRRSPLGLIFLWAGEALAIAFLVAFLILLAHPESLLLSLTLDATALFVLTSIVYILMATLVLIGLIATKVYLGNRLHVTNKRLIHQEMLSIFSNSVNVIELKSVEDVSFSQSGLVEKLFRLGTIRMSTVGDETTYTFRLVDTPTDELETISHLVHLAKNRARKKATVEALSEVLAESTPNPATTATPAASEAPTASTSDDDPTGELTD